MHHLRAMENVVAISFAQSSKAYEGLTKLSELDSQGRVGVREGAVVERDADGQLTLKDELGDAGDYVGIGTASGGLIGLLVGVLAGPVGMLLGGSLGILTGSVFDLAAVDEQDTDDSILREFARHIGAGETAVLALLVEQTDEVVDSAMESLGGDVVRRPSAEVEAEVAAAAEAAEVAEREAQKKLRKERREARKEDVDAKLDSLRAKLHPTAKS
jgi:uncharacterized membrane protein